MKLKEIIEDADFLVPNGFPIEQKVKWLNQTQRQLYRDYPLWKKVYTFSVTSGRDTYPIPSDCSIDQIERFNVGQSEYEYTNTQGSDSYQTYTFLEDKMVIFPVPTETKQAKLFYQTKLADLTPNDMEEIPPFPEDYHEILVLGIAYRMAQRKPDYAIANELEMRYKTLTKEAQSNLVTPRPRRTVVSRLWI